MGDPQNVYPGRGHGAAGMAPSEEPPIAMFRARRAARPDHNLHARALQEYVDAKRAEEQEDKKHLDVLRARHLRHKLPVARAVRSGMRGVHARTIDRVAHEEELAAGTVREKREIIAEIVGPERKAVDASVPKQSGPGQGSATRGRRRRGLAVSARPAVLDIPNVQDYRDSQPRPSTIHPMQRRALNYQNEIRRRAARCIEDPDAEAEAELRREEEAMAKRGINLPRTTGSARR